MNLFLSESFPWPHQPTLESCLSIQKWGTDNRQCVRIPGGLRDNLVKLGHCVSWVLSATLSSCHKNAIVMTLKCLNTRSVFLVAPSCSYHASFLGETWSQAHWRRPFPSLGEHSLFSHFVYIPQGPTDLFQVGDVQPRTSSSSSGSLSISSKGTDFVNCLVLPCPHISAGFKVFHSSSTFPDFLLKTSTMFANITIKHPIWAAHGNEKTLMHFSPRLLFVGLQIWIGRVNLFGEAMKCLSWRVFILGMRGGSVCPQEPGSRIWGQARGQKKGKPSNICCKWK